MPTIATNKPSRDEALGVTVSGKIAEILYANKCKVPVFTFDVTVISALTFEFFLNPPVDGSILEYLWEFGDTTTSTDASPQKTFLSIGTYNIVLTCTNACGASKVKKTLVIDDGNTFLLYENSDFILSENGIDLFIGE